MLTYSADFWPLFWTILGGVAVLNVLASLLVATFPKPLTGWHHRQQRPAASPPAIGTLGRSRTGEHLRAAA